MTVDGTASRSRSLLLDDGAIVPPDFSPSAVERAGTERMFRGEFLIHLNAPAGSIAGPQVAVFVGCAARENLGFQALDDAAFLDAEVGAGKVEVQLRRVADGRHISGAVPG